jgi:adenylate kinase family enzyme
MVVSFECPEKVAQSRFLQRNREAGDDQAMFDKRYTKFEENNAVITNRYRDILERVGLDA